MTSLGNKQRFKNASALSLITCGAAVLVGIISLGKATRPHRTTNSEIMFQVFFYICVLSCAFVAMLPNDIAENNHQSLFKVLSINLERIKRSDAKIDERYRWPNKTVPYWVNMTYFSKCGKMHKTLLIHFFVFVKPPIMRSKLIRLCKFWKT